MALSQSPIDIEWTRANLREVLPDLPSPQALSLAMQLQKAVEIYYGELLAPQEELGPYVTAFYGRPYFNLSQMKHLTGLGGLPPSSLMNAIGHGELITEADHDAPRPSLRRLLKLGHPIVKIIWKQIRAIPLLQQMLQDLSKQISRLEGIDPNQLSEEEIWKQLSMFYQRTDKIWHAFNIGGLISRSIHQLETLLRQTGFSPQLLMNTQTAIGEKTISARQAFDLLTLGQIARREEQTRRYFAEQSDFHDYATRLHGTEFMEKFEEFLKIYGHRAIYETDWSLPRFQEDPTLLLQTIRNYVLAPTLKRPEEIQAEQEREAEKVWSEFLHSLTWSQRLWIVPKVRRILRWLKQLFLWREKNRFELVQGMALSRKWGLAFAEKWVARGLLAERDDYFWLTLEEVKEGATNPKFAETFREIVQKRKQEYETYRKIEMPNYLRQSQLSSYIPHSALRTPHSAGSVLKGLCLSPGYIEGEVIVLRSPQEFAQMKQGAIVVAPVTDPSWTPIFTLASGLIVEMGGLLSHASTVAREYGLPAIGNIPGITKRLKTGDRVKLDASRGIVVLQK